MKSLLTSILLILCLARSMAYSASTNQTKSLTVTTFNLKWFGLGGNMWNNSQSEFRIDHLKKFIAQELLTTDVFVFVEVVHPESLSLILASHYQCSTYEREQNPKHQRIVTCYDSNKYHLQKYDNDFEITSVALGSRMLRPAFQAKLCRSNNICVAQIIGLHLIAGNKTAQRQEQLQFLKEELDKQQSPLPTIIAGDLNSIAQTSTDSGISDIDLFEQTLTRPNRKFSSVNKGIKTFGSGERAETLDHILISEDIQLLDIKGYEACQKTQNLNRKFVPYFSFRRYYSDHCPITARLKMQI